MCDGELCFFNWEDQGWLQFLVNVSIPRYHPKFSHLQCSHFIPLISCSLNYWNSLYMHLCVGMFKRMQLPVGTKCVGSPGDEISDGSELSKNQTLILPKSWVLPNHWTISPASQLASNWMIKLISGSENWKVTSFLEILVWVLKNSHTKLKH